MQVCTRIDERRGVVRCGSGRLFIGPTTGGRNIVRLSKIARILTLVIILDLLGVLWGLNSCGCYLWPHIRLMSLPVLKVWVVSGRKYQRMNFTMSGRLSRLDISIRIVIIGLVHPVSGNCSTIWLLECAKLFQQQVFPATNELWKAAGRVQ